MRESRRRKRAKPASPAPGPANTKLVTEYPDVWDIAAWDASWFAKPPTVPQPHAQPITRHAKARLSRVRDTTALPMTPGEPLPVFSECAEMDMATAEAIAKRMENT